MTLALVLVVIALTAIVEAAETAFSKLSAARVDELMEADPERNRALPGLLEKKPKYVNALRLLASIGWAGCALTINSFLASTAFGGQSGWITALIVGGIGFVVLGVGATTIGRQHSASLARNFAPFVRPLATLLAPVVRLLILVGNAITPGKGMAEGPFASAAEMRELLDQVDNTVLEDDERKMLHSVFELGDTVAREVMVPRTEMVWIEKHKTLRQGVSLALRSGCSRIPVIGEDVDDVIGMIYLKDLTKRVFEHSEAQQSETVESLMRPVLFSPDSRQVDDLLRQMQAARTHIAVLIDEYGGTAGLVTIEDILEEIVGEINDEYDTAASEVTQIDEHTFRVSSRLHIEDLADLIGIQLDADEEGIDTVAGLLSSRLGRVPIAGSSISIDGWTLTAETIAGRRNRMVSVLVKRNEEPGEERE